MHMTELINNINELKKQKNALILAHYYTRAEIQEIADYVGDSYYLSKKAKETEKEMIVFCGVHFMGESVKLLNPDKIILMPDLLADCPMAHMVTKEDINKVRARYDDLAVVCYINSTAEIKAMSDVCVTSSNAVTVIRKLANKNIYFIPDQYLGKFVAHQLPEKFFIFSEGFCPIHERIDRDAIKKQKNMYKEAKVIAHPECRYEVCELADYVGSTAGLIEYVKSSKENTFIVCTEKGILHKLQEEAPNKDFIFPAPEPLCPNMKLITLEKVKKVLENLENQVSIQENYREKAGQALRMMHKLSE